MQLITEVWAPVLRFTELRDLWHVEVITWWTTGSLSLVDSLEPESYSLPPGGLEPVGVLQPATWWTRASGSLTACHLVD